MKYLQTNSTYLCADDEDVVRQCGVQGTRCHGRYLAVDIEKSNRMLAILAILFMWTVHQHFSSTCGDREGWLLGVIYGEKQKYVGELDTH